MLNNILIYSGKTFSAISKSLNIGNGSTWPGHIALKINKNFIHEMLDKSSMKVILVAGTNGKTTTSLMLKTILELNGKKIIHNASGANLQNGIASTLLLNTNSQGSLDYDYAIIEVDENTLPAILKDIKPDYLLLLNLFRDQLDRYGEVATIAHRWIIEIQKIASMKLIINADDPEITFIGQQLHDKYNVSYFGLENKQQKERILEHAVDSIYCPRCGSKLKYNSISYSHLGDWLCPTCHLKRPHLEVDSFSFFPLVGTYNKYNTLAAVTVAKALGMTEEMISESLKHFQPAFGRQEIIEYQNKKIQIFLSKNPTGFNESLKTIQYLQAKTVVIVLNDQIADGTDVSWIWDIDTEILQKFTTNIIISGDRAYDLSLRIKYSQIPKTKYQIHFDIDEAINVGLSLTKQNEILFILPTYTAMLTIRKLLSGKEIL